MDEQVCGVDVIDQLFGGPPEAVPERYAAGSPAQLLPLGIPQRLLTGIDDAAVPPHLAKAYAAEARESGDDVTSTVLDNAAHFEVIVPGTSVWSEVRSAVLGLIGPSQR